MHVLRFCFALYFIHQTYSDWVSEWMSPVQDQIYQSARRLNNGVYPKLFSDSLRMMPTPQDVPEEISISRNKEIYQTDKLSENDLKSKLEDTLQNAKMLAETLKLHIVDVGDREMVLKDNIVNGRSGVTIATISTIGQIPRSYIIKDGDWMLCNGVIQTPAIQQTSLFNERLASPRCIGREVATNHDPCAFNSMIKYEVVPTTKRFEYTEDDYLCLKTNFNRTLEKYMSVTQHTVNNTCTGIIRSLRDNIKECGIRVMSEYTFYPYRSSASAMIPLEYCTQNDGSCKLLVAWHVSNTTIENFEFLKDDESFKKYFLKPEFGEIPDII